MKWYSRTFLSLKHWVHPYLTWETPYNPMCERHDKNDTDQGFISVFCLGTSSMNVSWMVVTTYTFVSIHFHGPPSCYLPIDWFTCTSSPCLYTDLLVLAYRFLHLYLPVNWFICVCYSLVDPDTLWSANKLRYPPSKKTLQEQNDFHVTSSSSLDFPAFEPYPGPSELGREPGWRDPWKGLMRAE